MSAEATTHPIRALVVVALGSTVAVHALPLWLGSLSPSLGLVAVGLIASFLLLHPTMTIPEYLVLRRESLVGRGRRSCLGLGLATGLASGSLVLASHAFVSEFVSSSPQGDSDRLASLIHPALGAIYGLLAALVATRPRGRGEADR